MTSFFRNHYNYLFRFFCFYSVFNEHLTFALAKISLWLAKISLAEGEFHFDEVKISLRSFASLGRPKWTRTTDLVLIRHAL